MIHSVNGYYFNPVNFICNSNFKNYHCNDQMVGTISFTNTGFSYNGNSIFKLTRKNFLNGQQRYDIIYSQNSSFKNTNKKIILLLESPHVDEFNIKNQNYTTAPIWGKSGDRFNSQFINVLNNNLNSFNNLNLGNNMMFDIYIVNAIQYQCSLGISPINKHIRNYVFQGMWNFNNNSFKDDLIDRIDYLDPYLIINACTINLQKTCCNKSTIMSCVKNKNIAFFEANKHISVWDKNTIIK